MEWISTLSGLIAAVVIPVVIALVGNAYTRAIREREIQGRLVELAIGILKEMPDEENREVRSWAVDVVDQFSGVRFPTKAKADLVERVSLPAPLTSAEYRGMARRLKAEKRFDAAVEAYRAAFDMDPSNPEPLNYAGVILSRDLNKFDDAEEMYERALEVKKDYVSPIYNKACNEMRRQNYTQALDYLEEAISKDAHYRQLAGRDDVFEAIRGDERFKRILQSTLQSP
jgi:tetratricopeptide (TPR) repeat protein